MKPTFNDKLIAYFTLFSGLAISAIAEYYSIMGLIAIYPMALIPIIVMGVVLGIGKISGTVWLKQNWDWSPWFLRVYILPAIVVLMAITSLGVFGFLSKAHSDQTLISGDIQSKVAIYDEKIKTARENIEANRKQLKQMDEAVDQVMGRSSDEKGADKANAIRKSQQRDRVALAKDIETNQKLIASLNEEAAPTRAEIRKVDAEVGPIKYIAHLLYGENPDANVLEKAVIAVTVLIVVVLDPLAVVLLLASQYSFQRFRQLEEEEGTPIYVADVGEKPTEEEKVEEEPEVVLEVDNSMRSETVVNDQQPAVATTSTVQYQILDVFDDELFVENPPSSDRSYLSRPFVHFKDLKPMPAPKAEDEETLDLGRSEFVEIPDVERPGDYVTPPEDNSPNFEGIKDPKTGEWIQTGPEFDPDPYEGKEYVMVDGQQMHVSAARIIMKSRNEDRTGYVQNEEQGDSTKWNRVISEAEYREKINDNKDNTGNAA